MAARASALVLAAGVAFTLFLQTRVRPGVFTQGDLGMKFLLTRQLATGTAALDLRLPGEPWVKDLWRQGLHPFPFGVRPRGEREFLFYPVTFPLVSAPLYRALGFRGLYVLPLVCTWVVWIAFARIAPRYGLEDPWRALALALLVFATPLTFYSATFWEHTLAVALAFPALAAACAPPGPEPRGARVSFALGALTGSAGWFREELLFLAAIAAVVMALPGRFRPRGWEPSVRRWPFVAGVTAAAGVFAAGNLALYGQPLGVHAEPFMEWLAWSYWGRSWDAGRFLLRSLADHYPIGLLFLALVPWVWRRRGWGAAARPALLLALSCAFCVAVPVLARHEGGRQFGPRFLLVVFPLSALAGGLLVRDAAAALGRGARVALGAAVVVPLAWGVRANSVEGERHLRVNYARRQLSLDAVRAAAPPAVAISHEFVAQQLADLVGAKSFFLTRRAVDLKILARELSRHGQDRFLYVCYPQYPCGPFGGLPDGLTLYAEQRPVLDFRKQGVFDRYVVYEAGPHPLP
jgi:hypothetical protein